jgi:acetylornithine/succinyldiaminopimelate/putrescine aminotransferase
MEEDGSFFSQDYANVNADIYSMAKGMGNGFPVAGILIAPFFKPKHGLLGTTFGGKSPGLCCSSRRIGSNRERKPG